MQKSSELFLDEPRHRVPLGDAPRRGPERLDVIDPDIAPDLRAALEATL